MMLGWRVDAASFERVYDSLQEATPSLRPAFGPSQWREQRELPSGAELVQDRAAATPRISRNRWPRPGRCSAFSPRPCPMRLGRLQEYLAPRLGHPEAVWVLMAAFPKQGPVARQYCGRLGKVALPGWDVPGLRQPAGPGVGGQACICPRVGPPTRTGVLGCAGGPGTTGRDGVAGRCRPGDAGAGPLGYLRAEWVAGDDAFGMSPTFREGLAALGMPTCWTPGFPPDHRHYGLALGPAKSYPGFGRPRKPAAAWAAADHGAAQNCRMRLGGR